MKEVTCLLAMSYFALTFLLFNYGCVISASHVTMSVIKLLARIVAPQRMEWKTMTTEEKVASELHDHTYGITSDPLTQFSVVLSYVSSTIVVDVKTKTPRYFR